MHVTDVRVEHHREPLGIGEPRPRLSWRTATGRPSWTQSVYEIRITDGERRDDDHAHYAELAESVRAAFRHEYVTPAGLAPAAPGYRRLLVRPRPGRLTHATAAHDTPYGRAEVAWILDDGELHLTVIVPPNTTAIIDLPGTDRTEVGSGEHHFLKATV
jgi:alpha-L-rhamnosidase